MRDVLDGAVPVADTLPLPWPTTEEAVAQLVACGLADSDIAAYIRVRLDATEGVRERLAQAVN